MKNKDLEMAQNLLQINYTPAAYDPVEDVKRSLGDFLKKRLDKLKQDVSFEEEIKDVIRARMAEADFGQLLRLLDLFQTNTNVGIANILSPFLQKIPTIEEKTKLTPEEELFLKTPREMLQSIEELGKLIKALQPSSHASSTADTTAIKEVLQDSQ